MPSLLRNKPIQVWEGNCFVSYYPNHNQYYLGFTNGIEIPDMDTLGEGDLFQMSTIMDIDTIGRLQGVIKERIYNTQ